MGGEPEGKKKKGHIWGRMVIKGTLDLLLGSQIPQVHVLEGMPWDNGKAP